MTFGKSLTSILHGGQQVALVDFGWMGSSADSPYEIVLSS